MKEIAFVGDIACNGILSTQPEKNSQRYGVINRIMHDFEIVFANLETPVRSGNERNEYKNLIHYGLPGPTEQILKLLNIGCVSLANNHIFDCKMSGLYASINLLDKLGIYHTGAGWLPEHVEPVIINLNGRKIAFLAYVDLSTNPKTENFPELLINYFDQKKVIEEVRKVREIVDKIVLSIHWGVDYSYFPTPEQIESAHILADAGVDVIMGHHSHTMQPFERYNGRYIFYGLGSLTFGDYIKEGRTDLQSLFRKTKKSVIVNYSFHENQVKFIPTEELKGNFIVVRKRDFNRWSNQKWAHFKIRYSSLVTQGIYEFHERVLYRIYEYFFGYYKNPLKRLFQFSNIKKVNKLFKKGLI